MKGALLIVFGQICGFSSTIMMVVVFFNEYFLHKGILFLEPNLGIAGFEFVLALTATVIQGIVMIRTVTEHTEPNGERLTGHEKTDAPYQ